MICKCYGGHLATRTEMKCSSYRSWADRMSDHHLDMIREDNWSLAMYLDVANTLSLTDCFPGMRLPNLLILSNVLVTSPFHCDTMVSTLIAS
ncbi:hypothetical protein DSO57_1006168 [Entomophthora muscae]|uniref:Uncharacterized protein n=1 Tax=Entomophthora muscae TaxID=34485 RepID=A0ACC2USM9_9FUNG|nr:hypothetical protein DSO57_1006168 [Entomophthora muscae]